MAGGHQLSCTAFGTEYTKALNPEREIFVKCSCFKCLLSLSVFCIAKMDVLHLMRHFQKDLCIILFFNLLSGTLSLSYCLNLFASAYWDLMTKAVVISFLVNTVSEKIIHWFAITFE